MYLAMLDCATSNPSLSSSPWIRGAPQSGFSTLIRRTNTRSSVSICGRPPRGRDVQRQYPLKPTLCQRTSVSGWMIVRTFRIDGNQRYSWIKNQRSWFVSRTRPTTPQDNQLMSKHRVLSLKPQLRLERRGQDGQNETEQPDHSASLGDSVTSSTRIRFSAHTAGAEPEAADLFKAGPHRCPDIGGVIGHDPAGCGGVPGRKGLKHGLMIEDRLFPGGVLKIAE